MTRPSSQSCFELVLSPSQNGVPVMEQEGHLSSFQVESNGGDSANQMPNGGHAANRMPTLSDNPLPIVIRAFPWNNGITLLHGSMAHTLHSLWGSNGAQDMGVQNSLLLVRHSLCSSSSCFQCSPTSTDPSSSSRCLQPKASCRSRATDSNFS
jgi:hypothetical protein